MLAKFLAWYRKLSIFRWHNEYLESVVQKWSDALREESHRADDAEEKVRILQNRLDEWIARSEGSRYRKLYEELKNKPNHLEAHANYQAKVINYLQASLVTMSPRLVDLAKEKARG